MDSMLWLWIGFNAFVLAMLALDLGVFHRHSHEVSVKEALIWSGIWIACAMVFNVLLYFFWNWMSPGSSYIMLGFVAYYTSTSLHSHSLQ